MFIKELSFDYIEMLKIQLFILNFSCRQLGKLKYEPIF